MSLRSIFGNLDQESLAIRLKIGEIWKIILSEKMKKNMSDEEFCKTFNLSEDEFYAIMSFEYNPKINKIIKILFEMGLTLQVVEK